MVGELAKHGLFVTGTDTGAGKSVLAAAILAALRERGEQVAAFKPAVTGLEESPRDWPPDHELLAGITGQRPEEVAPYRFDPPASPHYAAELAGVAIERTRLLDAARAAEGVLICEGVGGLMVPLTPGYLVRDLAVELALPLVVAARTGLGTINHCLLSVEAARAAGLPVAGIVMTPWPARPEPLEVSSRATVERLARAPVSGLPPCGPDTLAAAGRALPLDDWL